MAALVIIGKRLLPRFHVDCATASAVTAAVRSTAATTTGKPAPANNGFITFRASGIKAFSTSQLETQRVLSPNGTHQQCLVAPFPSRQILNAKTTSCPSITLCRTLGTNSSSTNKPSEPSKMSASKIRQNYHEESEAGVNKQINLELYASYVYQQLAFHFNRDDVALPGFEKFFSESSKEEREHAEKLMKFQNQRGGRIVLQDIPKPIKQDWASGLEAMEAALELEKTVNQSLLDLHAIAVKNNDPHFADFLETHYLTEQVEAIKKLSDYVTNLRRVGKGLGEYLFDKETLQS